MKLLRNRRAFLRWAETVAGATSREYGDFGGKRRKALKVHVPEPTQYPVWAYAVTASFSYEEERPEYLYKSDVELMLSEIKKACPAQETG